MKGYWQAAVGGLILALSFCFFSWETSVLSFFSFSLLFYGLAKRRNFLAGFLGGAFFFTPSIYWVYPTLRIYGSISPFLAMVALVGLSLILSLYIGLFSWLLGFYNGKAIYFAPFLWASVEILRENLLTGFPWGSLGYTAVGDLPFIQYASIGGVRLLGLFMVFLAVLLVRKKYWIFIFLLISLHIGGIFMIGPYDRGKYKVALFQSSWDFRPPFSQEKSNKVFIKYMKMADEASKKGIDLMVFPETTVPYIYLSSPQWLQFFKDRAKEWNAYVVFPSTETSEGKFYNSTFVFSPEGKLWIYRKIHLVPFGEYNPLSFLRRLIPRIAMEVGDYSPGKRIRLAVMKGHKFATPSCYEAIFPMLIRRMVGKGAEFLVNTTNDAWYGRTPAPYQHFMQARVRAVENRKYLLRAASSGISGIVDPYGRILKMSRIYKTETIIGKFSPKADKTLFVVLSPYLDLLYLTLTFIFLIISVVRRSSWKFTKRKGSLKNSRKNMKN